MITYKDFLELQAGNYQKILKRWNYFLNTIDQYRTTDYIDEDICEICEVVNIIQETSENNTNILFNEEKKSLIIKLNIQEKLPDDFFKRFINLKGISIECEMKIPDEIFELRKLQYLAIRRWKSDSKIERIYKMDSLEYLVLEEGKLHDIPDEISKLKLLKVLILSDCAIKNISEKLYSLTSLRFLILNRNPISEITDSIKQLINLESLYLGKTLIPEVPAGIKELNKLEYLALWKTNITELPDWICNLANLKGLYLGNTRRLTFLPEKIGDLEKLEKLYLNNSGLIELPDSFGNLKHLKELLLADTDIHKIPKINNMLHLENCDLGDMVLERIPREFINEEIKIVTDEDYRIGEKGLNLSGTKLLCQPISLFTHEKDFIFAYYEEEKIHLNESKIVFLGDGESGKSHIIRRIYEEGNKVEAIPYQATPGIDIVPKQCVIGNEYMNLQLWDFGGQDILHSMHRFFLTDRTLYIVVINARDNTQNERARYWLNNIKSFADGCPVIIVLNKMDQNPSAGLNETLLKSDFPQIKAMLRMSALNDERDKFDLLNEKIFETVKTFDSYAMEFPVSWNKIKVALTEMQENYIEDKKYRKLCVDNGVEDAQIQDWLLEWFHDLGVSFNYRKKDVMLGGYMVLKPQWITNAIYIILFNAKGYAVNGVINKKDIVDLLQNPPKAVEKIKYNIAEIPYILGVLRRFDISYEIDRKHEFIPMLCDEDECAEAKEIIETKNLEYFMEYQYLPNNVLHKLMIRMRDDLQRNKIWLTGMILEGRDNHITAVVRIHDRKLEIFIRSNNSDVAMPKEYLAEIRGHLSKINKELGLEATDVIIYEENGKREEIKYDDLLVHLKSGRKDFFSTVLRKEIPINQILGTVESNMNYLQWLIKNKEQLSEEEIRMLLLKLSEISYADFENELVSCCIALQGNYLVKSKGDENDRNTYLRDMLKQSGKYIVHDQTLNGISPGGKTAGELDLKICISKGRGEQPLSVVEALNLSSIQSDYLKKHINKIYNYDTWGAKNNYLVVYANTKDFAQFCIKYQDFLRSFKFPIKVKNPVVERDIENYSEIRLYDSELERNGNTTIITHIVVNIEGDI